MPKTSSSSSTFSGFSISNKRFNNGVLSICACSTSPFLGRVGSHRREGQSSLLSFGINPPKTMSEAAEKGSDSSQLLSAMLPFVVAATAIAALAQPSTFTWWVTFNFLK